MIAAARTLTAAERERPRKGWLPLAASAILAVLALVNLRALPERLAS